MKRESNKVMIFGASLMGKAALDIIKIISNYEIFAFIDNNVEKQEKGFCGYKVLSPLEAINLNIPIIIASLFKYEIKSQLDELKFKNYMFSITELFQNPTQEELFKIEKSITYVEKYVIYDLLYDFFVASESSDSQLEKNKVVICCETIYQLLTALLLKMSKLKNKDCFLLVLNKVPNILEVIPNIPSNMFKKITICNYNPLTKKEYLKIKKDFGTPELWIFFVPTLPLVDKLTRTLPKATKSIYADEGIPFYELEQRQIRHRTFDKIRVDEFWGYNKSIFTPPFKDAKIVDISYSIDELKQYIYDLNRIFNYRYSEIDGDIIFFDAPIENYMDKSIENNFHNLIFKTFENHDLLIKLHPSRDREYYKKDFKIFKYNQVPWEIVEINNIIFGSSRKLIFISLFSNATLFRYTFGSKINQNNNKIIFLYKIFDSITDNHSFDFKSFAKIINKISSDNIYTPSNIVELTLLLENLLIN